MRAFAATAVPAKKTCQTEKALLSKNWHGLQTRGLGIQNNRKVYVLSLNTDFHILTQTGIGKKMLSILELANILANIKSHGRTVQSQIYIYFNLL